MGYKDFKEKVKSLGGIWATRDVYFTQTRDSYYASYKPAYPDSSPEDAVISDITRSGAYLLGDFEFVRFDKGAGKVTATYFASFEDLEKHIKKESTKRCMTNW